MIYTLASQSVASNNGTSGACPRATLTANTDVMILAFFSAGAAPTGIPAGFTLIPGATVTLAGWHISGYYKSVLAANVAAEPTTYTFTFAASSYSIFTRPYYGVLMGTPFNPSSAVVASNSNATTVAIGGLTSSANGMLVSHVSQNVNGGTITKPAEMIQAGTTAAQGKKSSYAEERRPGTDTATGIRTWTFDSSALAHGGWLVCLNWDPAQGTGKLKVWNGSAWVEKPVRWYTGAAWLEKPVKVWDGSKWVFV